MDAEETKTTEEATIISMGGTQAGQGLPRPGNTCEPISSAPIAPPAGQPVTSLRQTAESPAANLGGSAAGPAAGGDGPGGTCPGPGGQSGAASREISNPAETPPGKNTDQLPDKKGKAEIVKAGKKNFAAVYLAATEEEKAKGLKGRVVEFSDQEALVLKVFLDSNSYQAAADEAGITVDSVKRMLRRPNLRRYLDEVITKAAMLEGMDKAWFLKELRFVWEGQKKPTKEMMDAAKLMEKVIMPRGPGVQVNVQQNSIYGGMSKADIDSAWAARRQAAGGNA